MPILEAFPRHPWAAATLLTLIAFICAIVILTSIHIVIRNFWVGYRLKRAQIYEAEMTEILLLAMENRSPINRPYVRLGDEKQFRDLMIIQIRSLTGVEKEAFIELYARMGYLRQDIESCKDTDWIVRLKALGRLDNVHGLEFGQSVAELLGDENELVAMTALKVLTHDGADFDLDLISELLRTTGAQRRHVVADVLTTITKVKGPALIVACVNDVSLAWQVRSMATVICAHFRVSDSVRGLVSALGEPGQHQTFIGEAIVALQRIGDPDGIDAIKPYLTHESPRLRALAILALSDFEALEFKDLEQIAAADLDAEVHRAVFRAMSAWDKKGIAA